MLKGSFRPVLLVGSVPLKPASEVFRVATHYLAEVMTRFPDGEQVGWLPGVWQRMAQNPALEPTRKVTWSAPANRLNSSRGSRSSTTASDRDTRSRA